MSDCANIGIRMCRMHWILPDTRYYGRIRIACSNAAHGPFTPSQEPFITQPGCSFSTTSGRDYEYECVDGSFCHMSDDSCCNGNIRGGVLRCPKSIPYMCHNTVDCGGSADRCCKATIAECDGKGGLRQCVVPAKEPRLVEAMSLAPASIYLSWEAQFYLTGRLKSCEHLQWRVFYRRVYPSWLGAWTPYKPCWIWDRTLTHCTIVGLDSMTQYYVQVIRACTNTDLNSLPARSPSAIETRPHFADPPLEVTCYDMTPETFRVFWAPGDPKDCTFRAWEVQVRILPREAGYNLQGIFEKFEPGGPYITKCFLTGSREDVECEITELLAGRDYHVRVAERCTDPFADSKYKRRYNVCRTLTMPAFAAENVTITDIQLYTFTVSPLYNIL